MPSWLLSVIVVSASHWSSGLVKGCRRMLHCLHV
jgi:hypothetical protein